MIARTWLTTDRLASEADLARVDREVDAEIEKGVAFAEAGEPASPIRLPEDVYAG